MTVKPLNRMTYYKVCRTLDQMTIEMYQEITSALLHDASPIELATELHDTWEMVAQTLYENDEITHKQCVLALNRIGRTLMQAFASLGVEPFADME